jgi:hypothetical protein
MPLTLHPFCRPPRHQVPFTDGKPLFARNVAARGWVAIIRGLLGGLHDLLRGSVTYPPAYYPIAGGQQGPAGHCSTWLVSCSPLVAVFLCCMLAVAGHHMVR